MYSAVKYFFPGYAAKEMDYPLIIKASKEKIILSFPTFKTVQWPFFRYFGLLNSLQESLCLHNISNLIACLKQNYLLSLGRTLKLNMFILAKQFLNDL